MKTKLFRDEYKFFLLEFKILPQKNSGPLLGGPDKFLLFTLMRS
jgi:hypothetical protein